MGKILDLNAFKKKRENAVGSLDGAQLDGFIDMLDIERGIVTELFQMTEDFLKTIGYNSSDFVIDKDYVRQLLVTDMIEFMEGGEEGLELSYVANIDGVIYRTLASAQSLYDDKTKMDVALYKQDTDLGEWVEFAGNDVWQRGIPGDFFGEKNRP